ncbi:MAG: histidine kinase dimerization/phosphoacceptor domain -containing protein [Hyphomonadaceae bacterium]
MNERGPDYRPLIAVIAAAVIPGVALGVLAALRSDQPFITILWTAFVGALSGAIMWVVVHRWFMRGLQPLQEAVDAFRAGEDSAIDAEDAPGEIRQVVTTLRDAAAAGRAREAQLEDALERNQILAREIHHRVQNNVQVLLSLVNRAQRRAEDPAARAAIAELGANMLPVTSAFSSVNPPDEALIVDGGAYLHRLAGQLQSALGGQARGVRLNTEIELGLMPIDDAVDLGLIVAEVFLSAHPGAAQPAPLLAQVIFSPPSQEKLGQLKVSVAYDDPGMSGRKLDAPLITELARQLRAKVEFPDKNAVAISWTAVPS